MAEHRGLLSAMLGLALAVAAPAAQGADCTFFVRAGFEPADGVADGRRPERAFGNISDGLRAVRNAGDVVCVGPGTYLEGDLDVPVNGSVVADVVVRGDATGTSTGDPPGPVEVRRSSGVPESEQRAGFRLLGRQFITIEGFEVVGFPDAGIQARSSVPPRVAQSANLTIRGNDIAECGNGIDVAAEGRVTIEGNEISNAASVGIGVSSCRGPVLTSSKCRSGESALVTPELANNRVAYTFSHGIFVQGASGGFVQNTVGFGSFTGITARAATRLVIVNNLLYGHSEDGITVGAGGQAAAGATILNNTLYENGRWGLRIGDSSSTSDHALVLNNIFSRNGSGAIALARGSACGYVAGYNLVADGRGYGPDTPYNVYDVNGDPAFEDPDGRDAILGWQVTAGSLVDYSRDDDFRLRGGVSGGIDAGHVSAAALGIQGSSRHGEETDSGTVDLGFHYGAMPSQRIAAPVPTPFMPVYVRAVGDDGRSGKSPLTALASLSRAAQLAQAGVTVVVGPGTYAAANVGPPEYAGISTFRADRSGVATGDEAGAVVIDPSMIPAGRNRDTGFLLVRSCGVTVDGFHVRFAGDAGIQVREGADGARIHNNVVFTNTRGISVLDANDVAIRNNLVYDNDRGGIDIGGRILASRARIQNNTCYGNVDGNGLTIGTGSASTPGTTVEFNLFVHNGQNGINARQGYSGRFNLFYANEAGSFGGVAGRQDGDRIDVDPLFVDPQGEDGRSGGRRFTDDRFELRQRSVGDTSDSPAVDAGPLTAVQASLSETSTRIDQEPDRGLVDLGYHYASRPAEVLFVSTSGDDANSGRLESLPLRSIGQALQRAMAGATVHIAAGRYDEGDLRPPAGVTVRGAGPASTVVSGIGHSVGFDIRQPDVIVRGLAVTAAQDAGIRVRADRMTLVDAWVYGNVSRGVTLPEGTAPLLFNNAIYDNGSTGIVIGSNLAPATRATVANNTLYGNGGFGITLGLDAAVASPAAVIVNNVIAANALRGIGVGEDSATSAAVGHNCNKDGYRGIPPPAEDLVTDEPLLVAPDGQERPDFRLAQRAAGDAMTSPCVDAGFRTASQLGLQDTTTRRDDASDLGQVDLGYHYGLTLFDPAILPLLRFGALAGDCDQDGSTRVNELVLAVSVAIESQPLSACITLDINGDDRVAINELLAVVGEALAQ